MGVSVGSGTALARGTVAPLSSWTAEGAFLQEMRRKVEATQWCYGEGHNFRLVRCFQWPYPLTECSLYPHRSTPGTTVSLRVSPVFVWRLNPRAPSIPVKCHTHTERAAALWVSSAPQPLICFLPHQLLSGLDSPCRWNHSVKGGLLSVLVLVHFTWHLDSRCFTHGTKGSYGSPK